MKISETEKRRKSVKPNIKRISVNDDHSRKLTMPIADFGVEESDLTDRFKVDLNTKPMLDDERARKMIIGEL